MMAGLFGLFGLLGLLGLLLYSSVRSGLPGVETLVQQIHLGD